MNEAPMKIYDLKNVRKFFEMLLSAFSKLWKPENQKLCKCVIGFCYVILYYFFSTWESKHVDRNIPCITDLCLQKFSVEKTWHESHTLSKNLFSTSILLQMPLSKFCWSYSKRCFWSCATPARCKEEICANFNCRKQDTILFRKDNIPWKLYTAIFVKVFDLGKVEFSLWNFC